MFFNAAQPTGPVLARLPFESTRSEMFFDEIKVRVDSGQCPCGSTPALLFALRAHLLPLFAEDEPHQHDDEKGNWREHEVFAPFGFAPAEFRELKPHIGEKIFDRLEP